MSSLTYPKAIFFAAVIIAAAIVFAGSSQVSGQVGGGGSYMISGDGTQFVWRVNTSTGSVSYCIRRDNTSDPALIAKRPPYCSAESPAAR